jgi:hypothetical protein
VLEGWETWPEIQHLCGLANAQVSEDQLERWRLKGLLPKVNQVGKGRGAGSETRFPVGTANQVIAIAELLSVKEKFSFVGWQLWMRGFNVDERYWKPEINNAILLLKRTPAFVRLWERQFLTDDKTLYDQFSSDIFWGTLFAKGAGKLSPDMRALALSLIGEVAKGQFGSFASIPNDDSKLNSDTILKLIGFSNHPIIAGLMSKSDFKIDFELQLGTISNCLRNLRANPSITIEKLTPKVRGEFLSVLAIASQLQLALPSFRKSPIAKFSNVFANDQKIQTLAIVLWSVFREMNTIQSYDAIQELAAIFDAKKVN